MKKVFALFAGFLNLSIANATDCQTLWQQYHDLFTFRVENLATPCVNEFHNQDCTRKSQLFTIPVCIVWNIAIQEMNEIESRLDKECFYKKNSSDRLNDWIEMHPKDMENDRYLIRLFKRSDP